MNIKNDEKMFCIQFNWTVKYCNLQDIVCNDMEGKILLLINLTVC